MSKLDQHIKDLEQQLGADLAQEEQGQTPLAAVADEEQPQQPEINGAQDDDNGPKREDSGEGGTDGDDAEGDSDDADSDSDDSPPAVDEKAGKKWGKIRYELKQERSKREELQAKLAEMQERLAKTEGFMLGSAKQDAAPEVVDAEPDRLLEPEEHQEWRLRQIEREKDAIKQQLAAITEQNTLQAELRGVEILESRFKAEKTDYDKAIRALENQERRIAKLNGMTDAQADAHIHAQKLSIFRKFAEQGKNPAEELYKAAIELGYYKPDQQEKRGGPDLEAIKRNKAKSASLIGAGRAGEKKISPEMVAQMNPWELVKNPKLVEDALAELERNTRG